MTTRKRISVLALLLASFATVLAPGAEAANSRHITVTSEGRVKVIPDAVRITATVTSVAASNKEALAATSQSAAAVRAALKDSKIATKDIATQSVSVYPEYTYSPDGGSTLVGYRGSQSFNIVVRAADSAGQVIDSIVAAAGNSVQLNGATPFVLDSSKSVAAARTVAVKSAKSKAAAYASLIGAKLGKVQFLVENSSPLNYRPVMALGKTESDATTIDLGEQEVTVAITVKWSLL
jgi:uncharacterized protein|tara:strand:+ start:2443 stop:3150 length:708 start_codon:yes stop_codon:yes gene_type:complete